MVVEVESDRIVSVQPVGEREKPDEGKVIDGTGKFLIPGLWDCHVHLTKLGPSSLPLFLAHGVTSVRDMGSDLAEVVEWRRQIAAGDRVGPRIKTSGQIMESASNVERMIRQQTVEPVERLRIPLSGPDDAAAAVRKLAIGGADFIKVRTVPDEATFRALAEASKAEGLQLTGHPVASPAVLAEVGMASLEHFLTITPIESADERQLLYNRLLQSGVRMSTTTINLDNSVLLSHSKAEERLRTDPQMKYVGDYLRRDWQEQVEERSGAGAEEHLAAIRQLRTLMFRDLREMKDAGVEFLAGSDAAVVFMYPGSSLHGELESLVRNVGMTPAEALRAATINPAAFFGMKDDLGSVEGGQLADLVLLSGNPLKDISNSNQIVGTMARGRWFDRAALDDLMRMAEHQARPVGSTPVP